MEGNTVAAVQVENVPKQKKPQELETLSTDEAKEVQCLSLKYTSLARSGGTCL